MTGSCSGALLLALVGITHVSSSHADDILRDVSNYEPSAMGRAITIDDISRLRTVDSLSISPDGKHFAILVREGDAEINDYRTGWYVGSRGSKLKYVGDGGLARPRATEVGAAGGEILGRESQWSPDGQWLAYTLQRDDEVQLWRSRIDGTHQQQLTRNAADVCEFRWSRNSDALYFSVGRPRAEIEARNEYRRRNGYRYDEDIYTFSNLMQSRLTRPPEACVSIWMVSANELTERRATSREHEEFDRAKRESPDQAISMSGKAGRLIATVERGDDRAAYVRIAPAESSNTKLPQCPVSICSGTIRGVWWSLDGQTLYLWRGEGINADAHAFYSWSVTHRSVSRIKLFNDDQLQLCKLASEDSIVCVRETKLRPAHIVAISMRSGSTEIIADVNPEFSSIVLGKVERIEWETPKFRWNEYGGELAGLYPARAYGYILYPPNFDPRRRYPVFIEPYVARGFNPSYGGEHALHVYAAHDFIVLNTAFPWPNEDAVVRMGGKAMRILYSAKLDFPHLSMLTQSTLRALDMIVARGFVDEKRVGIGGVSHGTFIPLYMLQRYDRIAAVSISSPTWGPHEYYWGTLKGRQMIASLYDESADSEWPVKPDEEGRRYWSLFDIADHVEKVEAPILMNLADQEVYGLLRLIRHLGDAKKPYDAYVFRDENHVKWQPAHLRAICTRNLDWFQFWLQNLEKTDPDKRDQYLVWRELKVQQAAASADPS